MECWFTIPFQTIEFKPIVFTVLNEHCPKAFAKLMNAKETEQEETDTQVLVSDSVTTTVALDELKANFDADEVKDNWDDSSDEGED